METIRTLASTKAFFGLALALALLVGCQGSVAEPLYPQLAEGFTSKDKRVGIVAAQRMFSVPTFGEICAPLRAPTRLVVAAPEPLRLVRGHCFSYDRLIVLAVDSSGRVLPPVPIAVDVEEVTPPVLNLRSDMTADPDGKVLPIRKGRFRFRFRTICGGHSAVAIVRAEVVEP